MKPKRQPNWKTWYTVEMRGMTPIHRYNREEAMDLAMALTNWHPGKYVMVFKNHEDWSVGPKEVARFRNGDKL